MSKHKNITPANDHYILSLKMRTEVARYRETLAIAFENGVPLEESKDNIEWTPVTESYFFPKDTFYRIAA